jgi:hypothetical protein
MPTPNVPLDILDRIRVLEDRLRQVEGRTQQRPAQNQVLGDVTISGGGRLIVQTPGGQQTLYVGSVSPAHLDGSPQQGFIVRREDGSAALTVWTGAGSGAQAVQVWDKSGNVIVADDLTAGGLARPYVSTDAWFSASASPTDTTTSTSFVTLQHLQWKKQHPQVTAGYLVQTASGTTGEIQLIDDNSNVIVGPLPIAAASFYWGSATGPIAGAHMLDTVLHWQARVTGGAGTIGLRGLSTFGVQS